jgi:hypothetical protein
VVRVIAELAQNPGGEDRAEAWLAGVDLSVRVAAKWALTTRPSWSIWVLRVSMTAISLVTIAA